jgi:uncharacterized protein (TIGR03000 family)
MYSLVLMMALTGGAETPARHGGNGCCGCYGGGGGCYGGDCNGGHRRHRHDCGGCYGNGGGCWGGHGCYGGGCNGGGCYGGRHNRHGCCGEVVVTCCGCHGGGHPYPPPPPPPGMGAPKEGEKLKTPPKPTTMLNFAPATIVVSLPADAKLSIDDAVTTSQTATRVFTSPALEKGKEFSYTLKAELLRDGRAVTTSERVTVRAGQETRVTLQFPAVSVAQR